MRKDWWWTSDSIQKLSGACQRCSHLLCVWNFFAYQSGYTSFIVWYPKPYFLYPMDIGILQISDPVIWTFSLKNSLTFFEVHNLRNRRLRICCTALWVFHGSDDIFWKKKLSILNFQKLLETILNWNIKLYFICNVSHVTWVTCII